MRIKRAYRRTDVKKIEAEELRERAIRLGGAGTTVGLDIGKDEIVVCIRWPNAEFERPWKVANTAQIGLLIERLLLLDEVCDSLTVGMESTGTYGEAVRFALTDQGLEVHRVSGKATSDYQEIFDGVPSQHDGKDAAIVAELCAFGKGTSWPFVSDSETLQQVKLHFTRIDCYRTEQTRWLGRLEGLLAKHWPELTGVLKLGSVTLLKMLAHYRSPRRLAADADAGEQLRRWGRTMLGEKKIAALLESARRTRGVPPTESESTWLGEVARKALETLREVQSCEKELRRLLASEATMSRYAASIGAGTLSAIWALVGDPRDYDSSGAFLKALGLNLKERSSGRCQGQLAITKRGPSKARRWIYFWSLRAIQRPELKDWYAEFIRVGRATSGQQEHRKMKGLVAMMRKLCRGLWYAMKHDQQFDYSKLLAATTAAGPRRKQRRRRGQRRGSSGSPSASASTSPCESTASTPSVRGAPRESEQQSLA
jgi:transposase